MDIMEFKNILPLFIIALIIAAGSLAAWIFYGIYKKHFQLDRIEKMLKENEFQKALDTSLKYLKYNSSDFLIFNLIGQSYEGLFQYRHAIENYEKVLVQLENEPRSSLKNEMRLKLGDLYAKIQDYSTSLGYYNLVLKENPKNSQALFHSAEVMFSLKYYIPAKRNLELYTIIKPDNVKASYLLAKLYYILGEFQKSVHELNKVIKTSDDLSIMFIFESSVLLADNYTALKRFKDVYTTLLPFLNRTQFLNKILGKIIYAMVKDKKSDDAMKIADDYFMKIPVGERCALLYQIANVYYNEGELFKAMELWKQAMELNPKYKDLEEIISKYHVLISHPYLEKVYTTDEGEFEEFILRKLRFNNENILERSELYWILKEKDIFHIIYKNFSLMTIGNLEQVEKIIVNNKGPNYSIVLYSYFGMENFAIEHYLYKRIKEISGNEFLEFFKPE